MSTQETEQQLLEAIRNGERQAMRRLYDRYSGSAMAVALRYVPQRDEALDVLQDGFVKILTTIDHFSFRGEGSLKAWVCRIVANRAVDYLKQCKRISFVSTIPDEAEDEPPDMEHIPPEALNRLIGLLPTGYRAVLNMYVFEQLSHHEIAQRLGISENTSASQFNRAKKKLAQLIREYSKQQGVQ